MAKTASKSESVARGEKLQKVLARAGLGSRREIEKWIEDGRVSVNGVVASLGLRVQDKDALSVDGRNVQAAQLTKPDQRVLVYHKPEGEICTRVDPQSRPTVFALLPKLSKGHWILVGRLDVNTSGLLLFTTDGELANRLSHPSSEVEREYAVRVLGEADQQVLARLKNGVELDDGMASFVQVQDGGGSGVNHWYKVVVKEGRNRLVRRLWESQGFKVSRLMRVRFGSITLSRRLRKGRWDELSRPDLTALYERVGLELQLQEEGFRGRGPNNNHKQRKQGKPRGRGRSNR